MTDSDPIAAAGKKWTDEETRILLTSIRLKKPIGEIAIEHGRTIGAIEARQRKLAADYWYNDKRPIDQIMKFTGLTEEQVNEAIHRRSAKYTANSNIREPEVVSLLKKEILPNSTGDMKEVISLLKDIQTKLNLLLEK